MKQPGRCGRSRPAGTGTHVADALAVRVNALHKEGQAGEALRVLGQPQRAQRPGTPPAPAPQRRGRCNRSRTGRALARTPPTLPLENSPRDDVSTHARIWRATSPATSVCWSCRSCGGDAQGQRRHSDCALHQGSPAEPLSLRCTLLLALLLARSHRVVPCGARSSARTPRHCWPCCWLSTRQLSPHPPSPSARDILHGCALQKAGKARDRVASLHTTGGQLIPAAGRGCLATHAIGHRRADEHPAQQAQQLGHVRRAWLKVYVHPGQRDGRERQDDLHLALPLAEASALGGGVGAHVGQVPRRGA